MPEQESSFQPFQTMKLHWNILLVTVLIVHFPAHRIKAMNVNHEVKSFVHVPRKKMRMHSNLRTSSTIKPFDRASWVRKLLLLLPIFLSTRNILTSSNFASAHLETLASFGLDLFLSRGRPTGMWSISFKTGCAATSFGFLCSLFVWCA